MHSPSSPADLFRRSLRLLLDKDISGWVDLWSDDGAMEFPFAPDGWPARLDGKSAIADYMRHYPEQIDLHEFPEVHIHRTTAPETIVVEMRGVGLMVDTGSPFDMPYIAVVTFRHEKFVSYRDYWNPITAVETNLDFRRMP